MAISYRTTFLGKLLGLYMLAVASAAATHKSQTLDVVRIVVHDPVWLFIFGIMTVLAGLAMVIGHNKWSGGALPVVITLIGWATLIKGLFFLFVSPESVSGFYLGTLQYERCFYFYMAFSLLVGLYLTTESFRTAPR